MGVSTTIGFNDFLCIQVFENLYSLQLEEDVNEVLFASPSKRYLEIDHLDEAATKLKAMLKFPVDVESDMKNLQRLQ